MHYEFVPSSYGRFFRNAQKSAMGLCSNRLHGWGMVVAVVIILLLSQGSLRNFR
jgi:hypothetical protein